MTGPAHVKFLDLACYRLLGNFKFVAGCEENYKNNIQIMHAKWGKNK